MADKFNLLQLKRFYTGLQTYQRKKQEVVQNLDDLFPKHARNLTEETSKFLETSTFRIYFDPSSGGSDPQFGSSSKKENDRQENNERPLAQSAFGSSNASTMSRSSLGLSDYRNNSQRSSWSFYRSDAESGYSTNSIAPPPSRSHSIDYASSSYSSYRGFGYAQGSAQGSSGNVSQNSTLPLSSGPPSYHSREASVSGSDSTSGSYVSIYKAVNPNPGLEARDDSRSSSRNSGNEQNRGDPNL